MRLRRERATEPVGDRSRVALTGLAATLAAYAGGVYAPTPAGGASTQNLTLIPLSGDSFWNYDFASQSASSSNVDWPINLMFYGDATINRVKDRLNDKGLHVQGSTKYGRLRDGSSYVWDQDGGRKTRSCGSLTPCIGYTYHYRIYADADDRMYNPDWNYYVIGTSHIDNNEGWFGEWFGESEIAEGFVAQKSREEWGSSNVSEDYLALFNAEAPRNEGDHHWNNNQYATKVGVS